MKATMLKDNLQLWGLCLPGLLKVLLFSYIPYIWLLIAFEFYIPRKGLIYSDWVWFDNFGYLLKSSIATRLLTNAIVINVLGIFFSTITSIIMGLMLFEVSKKIFLKISQTVMILPYFVSWPLVGILVSAFLSERTGMITGIVEAVSGVRPDIYAEPDLWWGILTFVRVWKGTGLSAVTYYAVLMGTDKEIYEAASIDGASRFQCMRHVSLPSLTLMIVLNIIMSSANILRVDFGLVYYVTGNYATLYPKTDVIETYMFRALRTEGDYSISMATGLLQATVGLVLTIITNKICKKLSGESLF